MRKSCAKPVAIGEKAGYSQPELSTAFHTTLATHAENHRFYPYTVHKFCIQFCATKICKITEVKHKLSTLSTALIIGTSRSNKENYLLGTGG